MRPFYSSFAFPLLGLHAAPVQDPERKGAIVAPTAVARAATAAMREYIRLQSAQVIQGVPLGKRHRRRCEREGGCLAV